MDRDLEKLMANDVSVALQGLVHALARHNVTGRVRVELPARAYHEVLMQHTHLTANPSQPVSPLVMQVSPGVSLTLYPPRPEGMGTEEYIEAFERLRRCAECGCCAVGPTCKAANLMPRDNPGCGGKGG